MTTKKSWFDFVKCLFVCEAKPNPEKNCMKWSWIFGRIKIKQQQAAIVAPERTILSEAREEQRKHALHVAVATAAAADAAVAAANAAAHLVKLTDAFPSYHPYNKRIRNFAATRIQCAYRGHLARKAFKALKGLVKLQAIVRGRLVRRQAATTSKYFQSISNVKSMAQQRRVLLKQEHSKNGANQQLLTPKELKWIGWGSWDDNIISVEDMEALWSRKKEAIAKRERMLTHSFSHRERRDNQMVELPSQNKENGRLVSTERLIIDRPTSVHRRSFSRTKHNSIGDESSFPKSPSLPTYMLTTESAKAKCRSMSMPKQRSCFMDIASMEYTSPRNTNKRHSFDPSLNGESIGSSMRRNGTTR